MLSAAVLESDSVVELELELVDGSAVVVHAGRRIVSGSDSDGAHAPQPVVMRTVASKEEMKLCLRMCLTCYTTVVVMYHVKVSYFTCPPPVLAAGGVRTT